MALTDRDTSSNYLGELFLVGAYKTPFLNMMGGMDGSRAKMTKSMQFPCAQPYSLTAASIPAIDEDELVATRAATTVARGQDINTVMIFKEDVEVSYLKQAAWGELSGISALGDQPVTDEFAFQKMAALRQMAIDMDLSFLTGTYAAASDSSTPAQTNGIITACASNTVDAETTADLSKTLIDTLMAEMATNGAVFENMVLFCNALQKQRLSDIYGYAPESRNVGGVDVQQIYTDFAQLGVVYAPNMPTDTILVADMNFVYPVFMPAKGQTVLYEDLAKVAGARKGQFISFAGVDYGPEEYHGTITGLTTS
jgi:hypothetical protein